MECNLPLHFITLYSTETGTTHLKETQILGIIFHSYQLHKGKNSVDKYPHAALRECFAAIVPDQCCQIASRRKASVKS